MNGGSFAFVRRLPNSNDYVLFTINGSGLSEKIHVEEAAKRGNEFIKQGGLLSGCRELIDALTTHSAAALSTI